MERLIIYGSRYGTTKAYAEQFAKLTGISVVNYETVKDLAGYGQIIYFGGLYAGGVKGLKRTVKKLEDCNERLVVVTVGLADVSRKENTEHIKNSVAKQVGEPLLKRTTMFHLRGGIDYGKLSFKHKMMMRALYHSLKNKAAEKMTQEDKALIETYNTKVDFVDFRSLEKIAKAL